MSNHTPGPWEKIEHKAYHTSYIIRGGQAQNQIAQCFNWQDKGFDVNSEANARLISAAPELLQALIGLLDVTEDIVPLGSFGDKARAAIAKATGANH